MRNCRFLFNFMSSFSRKNVYGGEMTKNGWIPNAKLVFKSTRKTGDYQGKMNHDLLSKWFSEQLLLNLPKHSLIIMDNAPYHNTLSLHSAPTASCKKDEIRAWFIKNRIPVR